jgi:hypothetical protein
MPPPPAGSSSPLTRRAWLRSAPVAAAALLRCSRAIYDPTRLAETFVIDPEWRAYRPIIDTLVTTLLPFDDPRFPAIAPEAVVDRLIRLFPIDKEQKFLGLQRTIVLFDEIDLFPIFSGPLWQEEMKARDARARGLDEHSIAAGIVAADREAFRRFRAEPNSSGAHFTTLPPELRRQYLDLWRNSASLVKRQFGAALKSLVMITVYSMDSMWPAIGYRGPLLRRSIPS